VIGTCARGKEDVAAKLGCHSPLAAGLHLRQAELLYRSGEIFGWLQSGTLHVKVDKSFDLAEAAEEHKYLEAGKSKGKVLY